MNHLRQALRMLRGQDVPEDKPVLVELLDSSDQEFSTYLFEDGTKLYSGPVTDYGGVDWVVSPNGQKVEAEIGNPYYDAMSDRLREYTNRYPVPRRLMSEAEEKEAMLVYGYTEEEYAAYKEEQANKPPEQTLNEWLDEALLKEVNEYYESYSNRKERGERATEPKLTVAFLRDSILQYKVPEAFEDLRKQKQNSLVRSRLNSLTRRGLLSTSIGTGERGGDARMWEPANWGE